MRKLDAYSEFMNNHVLNAIGIDLYNLLDNGLAFDANEFIVEIENKYGI